MATVNLGRIKPIWQGQWAASTAYVKDDIVRYGADAYICVTAHTSSADFATDSANWETMAQGADIPSQTGQAGKVLKTDGSSLSWANSSGGLLQVKKHAWANVVDTNVNTTWADIPGSSFTFTPVSSSSTIVIQTQIITGLNNVDSSPAYGRMYTAIVFGSTTLDATYKWWRHDGTARHEVHIPDVTTHVINNSDLNSKTVKGEWQATSLQGSPRFGINVAGDTARYSMITVFEYEGQGIIS